VGQASLDGQLRGRPGAGCCLPLRLIDLRGAGGVCSLAARGRVDELNNQQSVTRNPTVTAGLSWCWGPGGERLACAQMAEAK